MSITLSVSVAAKYKSDLFVETGTHSGGGIDVALQAHYPNVISIENDSDLFTKAIARFSRCDAVKIYCGSSPDILRQLKINSKATFWLDAHSMTGPENPLLQELDAIASHPIKSHTILIDDMRCMKSQWGIEPETIMQKLCAINPEYTIDYEDSCCGAKDIMVAVVR